MDRISKSVVFHPTILQSVRYGADDSVPIDQQPCKEFNIDLATGRPMSDITAVIRAQGLDKQRLLADLTEFKADYLPEDVSDTDALKYAIPRLTQLPSELAEYSEAITKARLEEKAEKERQLKLDKLLKEAEQADNSDDKKEDESETKS